MCGVHTALTTVVACRIEQVDDMEALMALDEDPANQAAAPQDTCGVEGNSVCCVCDARVL